MRGPLDLADSVCSIHERIDQHLAEPSRRRQNLGHVGCIIALDVAVGLKFPANESQDLVDEIGDVDQLHTFTCVVRARKDSEIAHDVGDGLGGKLHLLEQCQAFL
jgi:hypothetical protein